MNKRGFTLVEVLGVLVILSLVFVFVLQSVHSTLSIGKDEAYEIMKDNILSASYDYAQECISGTLSCNLSFNDEVTFSVKVLRENGYFSDLKSPIDGKSLEDCMFLVVKKENGVVISDLLDYCY